MRCTLVSRDSRCLLPGGRWWRGKWRHFRREPTTSRRRRCGPQPISFVNGIDFRGRVVPPTVHPPTVFRRRRLVAGGSRVHQTWRPLTVGALNGRRVDRCARALEARSCGCARVYTVNGSDDTVFLPPLTVRPPTGWCNFRFYYFPGFFSSTVFFFCRRTPDSLKTSRHSRERNVTVTLCNHTVRRTPSSTNPYRPCRLCRTTTTIRSSLDRRRPVVRTHHHHLSENGTYPLHAFCTISTDYIDGRRHSAATVFFFYRAKNARQHLAGACARVPYSSRVSRWFPWSIIWQRSASFIVSNLLLHLNFSVCFIFTLGWW